MSKTVIGSIILLVLAGCGPSVMVSRLAYYPAKPDNCPIDVLNNVTSSPTLFAGPNAQYETVGMISMGQVGAADPFSPEYIAILHPRACALGGDSLSMMASSQVGGLMGGSGSTYMVLRKRGKQEPGSFLAPPGPSR